MKANYKFQINGKMMECEAHSMDRLLDILREEFRLTGTKEGCGEGECGACSVFLDDQLVNSCLVPMAQVQGRSVKTIESIAADHSMHIVQKCFLECGGAQCGICTPGMVMASVALLKKNDRPSRGEIKEALAGNLCRCTGYMKIFDSVEAAAEELRKSGVQL